MKLTRSACERTGRPLQLIAVLGLSQVEGEEVVLYGLIHLPRACACFVREGVRGMDHTQEPKVSMTFWDTQDDVF